MPVKERDSQREKCYRAERQSLHAIWSPLPTVADVEKYMVKQMKRVALVKRYGTAVDLERFPVFVADGRGRRNACSFTNSSKIAIPLWARNDVVVLHELAHTIHDRLSSRRYSGGTRRDELAGGAPHGWQWLAIYLDLIHFCLGAEASTAFKAAIKANKARYRPKRIRVVSQATLDALAAARMRNAA